MADARLAGELAATLRPGEELESQHPRLYAQMQRHNEIWERAWRYYNLDAVDAQEEGEKKRSRRRRVEEEAMRAGGVHGARERRTTTTSTAVDVEAEPKKKKKKVEEGTGTGVASISLSARNAGAVVEAAFERAGKWAMRRPTIAAFAERRAMARARRGRGGEGAGRVSPFASRPRRALRPPLEAPEAMVAERFARRG